MNKREELKKYKEWNSMHNIIPIIQDYLGLDSIIFDNKYLHEGPDFIFKNEDHSVGVEVVECHPSVQRNGKKNAMSNLSFQNRICRAFTNNDFLISITGSHKLYILIDQGCDCVNGVPIQKVCTELELRLKALFNKGDINFEPNINLVRRIRVHNTVGANIVAFNHIARRDETNGNYLKKSIIEKEEKLMTYIEKSDCDEYWLCIDLPFEENCQSNNIYFESIGQEYELRDLLISSKYDRICLTSAGPNDLRWLKGNPKL